MLSHIFLAFFERIHGKIYMRKIKQRKGVNPDENNRFEQLSLFELCMGDDESSRGSETSEGKKQSIIYHFEGEESRAVEQSGISALSGDQFTLHAGAEGTGSNVSSITGVELDGKITEEGTAFESSQRNNMAVDSDSKSATNQVLERVHLEDERLSTRTKIQYNIEALKTVRQLQKENRTATLPEKEKLARFSGWGGCPHVFNESDTDYTLERKEIKELLTVHEYANAKESTLTSFYTPLNVIDNIYRILERMGFNQGRIIETSMGNGNFFGRMPNDMYSSSTLCGVELDSMSATISRYLYDKVDVENTGFENNPYPNNYFDLAISNVPFGFFQVHDMQERDLNEHHWNIHNYFFAKALKKVRNGGVVAFITSTDTMDGKSDILSYINEKSDFLGALRLPSNLFHENGANTDVACDIVFIKRNDEKEVNRDALFTQRRYVTEHRQMNDYFVMHPDHVFGRVTEEKGQFDNYVLKVTTDKDKSLQNYFDAVINDFPEGIYEEEQISEEQQMFIPMDVQHSKLAVNAFFVENDKLYFKEADFYYEVGISSKTDEDIVSFKNETDRLKAICLIKLADTANELIRMQVDDVDEILYLGKRAELNALYDDFVKEYGPIHKRTNIRLLDNDPRLALLDSLENYDTKTKRASDIEQQNGRAFRQGNMYNKIYEFRYVTKKSFDAYSWQMVETKSSYVTQLLEGTGDTREFEEDTQNSFSYAEVKAIASGNPIIKEKFEVDNEVKRLETMRRSWQKKKLQAQDDVALLPDRIETEKKYRTILAEECEYFKDEIEANNLRDTEHFTFYDVNGNEYHDLKEAWDAIQECTKGYKLSDYKENKFVGRFMKADVLIGLGLAGEGIVIKMKTPLRTINVDSVNPVGRVNFNRMYKRINDIRYSLNKTIETIQNYEGNLKIAKEMVNKPFELQDELTSARNRQKEINKILDTSGNENSKVVVEDDLEEERNESCMEL